MIFAFNTATQESLPVLLIGRKRRRCPKAAISLIQYCSDNGSNGIVLLGLWSSDEHVNHLLTNIDLTIDMLCGSKRSLVGEKSPLRSKSRQRG